MKVGGEVYTITVQVLRLFVMSKTYPIFLGGYKPRRANATTDCSTCTSHVEFWASSQHNNDKNCTPQEFLEFDLPKSKNNPIINSADLANQVLGSKIHLGPIKDLGLGFYHWENMGEFIAWMNFQPHLGVCNHCNQGHVTWIPWICVHSRWPTNCIQNGLAYVPTILSLHFRPNILHNCWNLLAHWGKMSILWRWIKYLN